MAGKLNGWGRKVGVPARNGNGSLEDFILHVAAASDWSEERTKTLQQKIHHLRATIDAEVASAVKFMSKDHSLDTLNEWIRKIGHGLEEQPSKTKAAAELRKIHINIFDLINGRFEMVFTDFSAFRRYTNNARLFFPRDQAKENRLNVFLRKLG